MNILFSFSLICSLLFQIPVDAGLFRKSSGIENENCETIEIYIPQQEINEKWKCACSLSSEDAQSLAEWIPKGQNFGNLSEMITVHFFSKNLENFNNLSAIDYVKELRLRLDDKYPTGTWNVIKQSEYDVLYEWRLPNENPPQHEIARVITTNKGMHRVAYEMRVKELDKPTRDLWMTRIGTAKVVNKFGP